MVALFPKAQRFLRNLRRSLTQSLEEFQNGGKIRYEMAACLRFKDVARYLPEWLEFHSMVGVEHFYLYNNNSTDNYQEALAPYVRDGLVTLHEWPHVPAVPGAD